MSRLTILKSILNRILQRFNLRIETLTTYNREKKRISSLLESGYFEKPVFDVPKSFLNGKNSEILNEVSKYQERFDSFARSNDKDVGYSFDNDYFSSPDAEVLYSIIQLYKPSKIIEIGSGYSTKLIRQAIVDGTLKTKLICIDPKPRTDIRDIADSIYNIPVENINDEKIFYSLKENDILFIDSSHEIHVGNDVLFIYLNLLPNLPKGVFIHIHDIFLPYEYPEAWIVVNRWNWKEQYLIQTILLYSKVFEVIWPGYYLHKHLSDFNSYFPNINGRVPKSLWLFKKKDDFTD